MNAAILAVGTEITSGQIQNSHATWISGQLEDLGITTLHHLAVPDDQELILDALDFLEPKVEMIFVTGGLGPTSDDFTRQVVADWVDSELTFHEDVWQRLQSYLQDRKIRISPNHRNQCYFPEGAEILPNPVGTAHGFFLETATQKIWVLPGPPPELQGIWTNEVLQQLKLISPNKEFKIKKWRCLGRPESDLADLTESILEETDLQTGYRLAPPYVEIKVWVPNQLSESIAVKLQELNTALKPWLTCVDDQDIAFDFLDLYLNKSSLLIIDQCTQGHIVERLMHLVRTHKFAYTLNAIVMSAEQTPLQENLNYPQVLSLMPAEEESHWWLVYKSADKELRKKLNFDFYPKMTQERRLKIITEHSLKSAIDLFTHKL